MSGAVGIVHKTNITGGDDGFWLACTCLMATYHRTRDEAESYAANHLAHPPGD